MPSPRFQVVPSAYLVMLREASGPDGPRTEVLLQLRRGTGYMDEWWACAAAGHVEPGESVLAAAHREATEELGITVPATHLVPLTTLHRHIAITSPLEERYDTFVELRHLREAACPEDFPRLCTPLGVPVSPSAPPSPRMQSWALQLDGSIDIDYASLDLDPPRLFFAV